MTHRHRGRPKGSFGYRGYTHRLSKVEPKLGSLYHRYGTQKVERLVKQAVKKELGRPSSKAQSMRVIGGHLKVRLSKSRVIRVGNKEMVV